jgi:hypothetical protein
LGLEGPNPDGEADRTEVLSHGMERLKRRRAELKLRG